MELPIRIIVILFVAVVVGGLMIVFSQQVLMRAQVNLNNQQDTNLGSDRIISVENIDTRAMEGLIDQCYKDNNGVNFEETPCFAVFTENNYDPGGLDSYVPGENFIVNTIASSGTAFRIAFNPKGEILIT